MTSPYVLLKAWNIRAKHHLGQNFLANPGIAQHIVTQAAITPQDRVLEIGPGLGALTIPMARQAKQVKAVEKDARLIGLLQAELLAQGISNTEIIQGDFLHLPLTDLLADGETSWIVAGNLPYNISSQVLVRLIESGAAVRRAILMFQTELAQRLTAPPGGRQYGRLSVMLQYCTDLKTIARVEAAHFFPRPKVDSQVLEIAFDHRRRLPQQEELHLFKVIKAAFAQRRKTLKNALAAGNFNLEKKQIVQILATANIESNRRAETLSVDEFLELSRRLKNQ